MSAETGQDPLYTHPDLVQFCDIENRCGPVLPSLFRRIER